MTFSRLATLAYLFSHSGILADLVRQASNGSRLNSTPSRMPEPVIYNNFNRNLYTAAFAQENTPLALRVSVTPPGIPGHTQAMQWTGGPVMQNAASTTQENTDWLAGG